MGNRIYSSRLPFLLPLFNSKSTELITGSGEVLVQVYYIQRVAIILKMGDEGLFANGES